jgi:hypothetical protein
MSEEIKDGNFEYLKWFPEGNKAHEFRPIDSGVVTPSKTLTVREFYEE